MRSLFILFISAIILFNFISCGQKSGDTDKLVISVIPKGTTHVFWQSVHAGAAKAGKEFNVDITWLGTEKEDDRQQQIALVDNQVMTQVDGIVLAPLDAMALRRPVHNAVKNNIPVIIIDSGLENAEDIYISFIATDNRKGGRIAGMKLAEKLNKKGKVVLLRYNEGSASTENREEGFLEKLREYPGIEVVSSEQYGGVTRASGQQASENLLLRFKDSSGNLTIDGIFTPNVSTTYGMLQALKRQNLAGKVTFVGFDAEDPLIEGMREGAIHGLVIQDPFKMGYLGVKMMIEKLNGRAVQKRIDTGVRFIELKDLDREEIQELISPNLDKWLNQ